MMNGDNQKTQQPPKSIFKRIVAPHLIAFVVLAGMVALNYNALLNTHGGLDSIGTVLGYVLITRFFEMLIIIDIIWLIVRLLSVKSAGKTQEKQKDQKWNTADVLRVILYVMILCISSYLCYSSITSFLMAWNAYHILNDLVALVSLAAAVLLGGLVGITCYNLIKLIKSKRK